MEMSLISVLLEAGKNRCYRQDARVSPVNPREGGLALCAFFLSSHQKEVLWLTDTSGPKLPCKKPFC